MRVEYRYEDRVTADFIKLVKELDGELQGIFGDAQSGYDQYNTLDEIKDVIIAYIDSEPVACASMKRFDDDTYELKRVFVQAKYRKFGIARELLVRLEEVAARKRISCLILETGNKLLPAINLYESLGYGVTENYGQYAGMADSLCMRKYLAPGGGRK
jgi:putative acetyltransferase